MQASILDLRYHMKDILKALDRNERVDVLYHGKHKGTIIPNISSTKQTTASHAFFGMLKEDKQSVAEQMNKLRGNRYHDI